MKVCPKCSAKVTNDVKFCANCGENLISIEPIPDETPDPLNKMSLVLNDGVKKAKDTISIGMKKLQQTIETKLQTAQSEEEYRETPPFPQSPTQSAVSSDWSSTVDTIPVEAQENISWEAAVNPNDAATVSVKKYPFFKEDDETTLAVIGERYAASDLNGEYQRPYAILTQKRLYCKNESGNFILKTSEIYTAREDPRPLRSWALWLMIPVAILFTLVTIGSTLVLAFLGITAHRKKNYKKASLFTICVTVLVWLVLLVVAWQASDAGLLATLIPMLIFGLPPVVLTYLYVTSAQKALDTPQTFSITCAGGVFTFLTADYSLREFVDFQTKAAPFCSGTQPKNFSGGAQLQTYGASSRSFHTGPTNIQQKSSSYKKIILILIALLAVAGIIVAIIYSTTHCKYSGCNRKVYEDGYCERHYYIDKGDDLLNKAEDYFGGF